MSELSSEDLFLVNDVGDRFEALWHRGDRPRIEDFLANREGLLRRVLLKHLLCIELELLRRAGTFPCLEDFEDRFSEDPEIVALAFAEDLDSACEEADDPRAAS